MKGCKLWDRVTEKMHDGDYPVPEVLHHWKLEGDGAYQDLDYRYLACVITGDTAELRVGDAEDHKTKIDLGRHMLEYHDPDQPTNLGVAELFRSIGLRCRVMESRGVVCRGVTKKKADEVFRATAMVTSMDRRMEHCRNEKNLSAAECRKRELRFYQQGAKRERA